MSDNKEEELNKEEVDDINEGLFSEDDELVNDPYNESAMIYDLIKELTRECIFPLFDLLSVDDVVEFLKE